MEPNLNIHVRASEYMAKIISTCVGINISPWTTERGGSTRLTFVYMISELLFHCYICIHSQKLIFNIICYHFFMSHFFHVV